MPKIRLGTAASRSTSAVSGSRILSGEYSVMNSAVAIEIGTAINSAITAMMTVPYEQRRDPEHRAFVRTDHDSR